jgi:hypothetical protein
MLPQTDPDVLRITAMVDAVAALVDMLRRRRKIGLEVNPPLEALTPPELEPDPFEPSDEDWQDYAEWSQGLEIDSMRDWYDSRPCFGDWLASENA